MVRGLTYFFDWRIIRLEGKNGKFLKNRIYASQGKGKNNDNKN